MIGAKTRLVALLGQPVAESLSPRMQNAAFAAAGLDWAYVACEVAPRALRKAVEGLSALGFAGANVTIPHKQAVVPVCDEAEGFSVNTLVFREGRVLGFNKDKEILAGIEAENLGHPGPSTLAQVHVGLHPGVEFPIALGFKALQVLVTLFGIREGFARRLRLHIGGVTDPSRLDPGAQQRPCGA